MATHKLGVFEVTGNIMVVSDPCYSIGTWMTNEIWNVKSGTWHAIIDSEDTGDDLGIRVSRLHAIHTDYVNKMDSLELVHQDGFGVDSGQAGIFDYAHYQDDAEANSIKYKPLVGSPWYDLCCTLTMHTKHDAGVLPHGTVSSSGFGDGSYTYKCYTHHNATDKNNIVAITLDYMIEEYKEKVLVLLNK